MYTKAEKKIKTLKKPLVSVVMPSYNRAKYIVAGVESALSQASDNLDIEVIVVDDGSIDNTRQLVEELISHNNNLSYYYIPNSGGAATPRNIGMDKAAGDYIAFLDSDDLYLPGAISELIKGFNDDAIALVWGNAIDIDQNGEVLRKRHIQPGQTRSGYVFEELVRSNFILTSSTIIRSEVAKEIGYFMVDPEHPTCEDYDYWLRLASSHKIKYIDKVLIKYRTHPESITVLGNGRELKDSLAAVSRQRGLKHLTIRQRRYLYSAIGYIYRQMAKKKFVPLGPFNTLKSLYFTLLGKLLYNRYRWRDI